MSLCTVALMRRLRPLPCARASAVAIGGAFWAWLYNRTNSLLAPWVSHALIDAGIFWIGYDLVRHMI